MPGVGFEGLRVLALESRHAKEMAKLIASYGGQPTVAPAMREVSVESPEALEFAAGLIAGKFDMVIFLTGAGIRALVKAVEHAFPRAQISAALQCVQVVARGAKPVSALRELGVKPTLVAPEPNTWRELLRVLDDAGASQPIKGSHVAVQEYGVPSKELLAGLRERGACVTTVPVYQWSLPEDIAPLQTATRSIANGEVDVLLLTSATQITHLLQIAAEMKLEGGVLQSLERVVIASIGPSTSELLRSLGLQADLEASHPRMGILVKEAAERSGEILREKQKKDPALNFLHDLGTRMAAVNPLHEVLDRVIEFASTVAKCDSCFVFVLEEDELVLGASKNPHP
ncbi:MAG: uroporphyrinogen-III synthase, partial [Candidatus Acidiferrum sp.]